MFDVSSRAKSSVSALAERKIASARPRKYGLLLRAEEEMLLYGQALDSFEVPVQPLPAMSVSGATLCSLELAVHEEPRCQLCRCDTMMMCTMPRITVAASRPSSMVIQGNTTA